MSETETPTVTASVVLDTEILAAPEINTTTAQPQEETREVGDSTPENVPKTDTFFLRFSRSCRPFKLPEYPEIGAVASEHFNDPAINCTYDWVRGEKVYRLETNDQHPRDQSLKFTVEGLDYMIKLDPLDPKEKQRRQTTRREDGLLLTFWQAGRKFLNKVPNKSFDELLQNSLGLEVLKPTMKQFVPNTTIFNGNRYAVVATPENLAKIPDTVPISEPDSGRVYHIRINYFGKMTYCARCMNMHGRTCPELKDFYDAKAKRKEMKKNNEIKTKILSDSTLRHADSLGLRADVLCMSGGGFGQVVQAAFDDPDVEDKDIVLLAGANDIKNTSFESSEEYAESINKSVQKLIALADHKPERNILVINCEPIPPVDEDRMQVDFDQIDQELDTARKIRREYLTGTVQQYIKEGATKDPPVTNIRTMNVGYDTDQSGHPTKEATVAIIKQIHNEDVIAQQLIWNESFIVSEGLYRGVQSIYRYGCSHCDKFGKDITHERHKNPIVCDECMDEVRGTVANSTYPYLQELILENVGPTEENGTKRSLEDEEEIISKKSKEDGEISESDESSDTITMDQS